MKIAEYVAAFLADAGVKDVFMITGGGMMHLLDGVTCESRLNLVFNLNEQASGICAEAYGQYTNSLGVCLVTTGPGATNAITGCAAAWGDSTPVLFISGQTKTADMGQLQGLRFFGAQEIGIVPMAKPITKYAEIVLEPQDIRYHLEKALWLAQHGRRGPVWLDIPLDIQAAHIDPENLRGFTLGPEELAVLPGLPSADKMQSIWGLLSRAKRPVFLIGHGVVADGAGEKVTQIARALQVPVLATWRAKGAFSDEDPIFFGYPGIPAPRYANYVLQNADFVLMTGTRLNPALTAYQEDHFAPYAQKVMVDIDAAEIAKMRMPLAETVTAGAGDFWQALARFVQGTQQQDRSEWLAFCQKMRKKYPLANEQQPEDCEGMVDGYALGQAISAASSIEDIYMGSSSGRTCSISHIGIDLKPGQKFVSSMGLGSMGWCLPGAVACCFASGKRRTLVIEGDGSLQHNIQELALLRTYNLPIKLFIWSNKGYASIYAMQQNNFEGRLSGCTPDTGLCFPGLSDIAKAYDLPYYKVETNAELDTVVPQVLADDEPCICEVMGSICFDEIPKSKTIAKPDGTFESSKLENLFPFLPEEEVQENLPYWENS